MRILISVEHEFKIDKKTLNNILNLAMNCSVARLTLTDIDLVKVRKIKMTAHVHLDFSLTAISVSRRVGR